MDGASDGLGSVSRWATLAWGKATPVDGKELSSGAQGRVRTLSESLLENRKDGWKHEVGPNEHEYAIGEPSRCLQRQWRRPGAGNQGGERDDGDRYQCECQRLLGNLTLPRIERGPSRRSDREDEDQRAADADERKRLAIELEDQRRPRNPEHSAQYTAKDSAHQEARIA